MTAKQKLWAVFSRYVRQLEKGVCFSCGAKKDWKETDAGHYIPKTAGNAVYFCEKNVHCQCTYCNRYMHGNLSQYALALIRKYGPGILDELDRIRQTTVKYTDEDYQKMTDHYKREIKRLGFK